MTQGLILNDMGGDVMYVTKDVTGALREQMKHHEPIVCYALDCYNLDASSDSYKTLTAGRNDTHNIPVTCYALEGNGSRPSHRGSGFSDSGIMFTLNTIEQHSVCYEETK